MFDFRVADGVPYDKSPICVVECSSKRKVEVYTATHTQMQATFVVNHRDNVATRVPVRESGSEKGSLTEGCTAELCSLSSVRMTYPMLQAMSTSLLAHCGMLSDTGKPRHVKNKGYLRHKAAYVIMRRTREKQIMAFENKIASMNITYRKRNRAQNMA